MAHTYDFRFQFSELYVHAYDARFLASELLFMPMI